MAIKLLSTSLKVSNTIYRLRIFHGRSNKIKVCAEFNKFAEL